MRSRSLGRTVRRALVVVTQWPAGVEAGHRGKYRAWQASCPDLTDAPASREKLSLLTKMADNFCGEVSRFVASSFAVTAASVLCRSRSRGLPSGRARPWAFCIRRSRNSSSSSELLSRIPYKEAAERACLLAPAAPNMSFDMMIGWSVDVGVAAKALEIIWAVLPDLTEDTEAFLLEGVLAAGKKSNASGSREVLMLRP